jgi:hypothetical protein
MHRAIRRSTTKHRRAARLGLGALAATAALTALPAMASAASTCTYDPATKKATISAASSITPVRIFKSGQFIRFSDASVQLGGCTGQGVTATLFNTDQLQFKSTNPPGFNHVIVPADLGPGATLEEDGHPEVEMTLFLGTGGDQVSVLGTPAADSIRVSGLLPTSVNFALRAPGFIDDETDDLRISTGTAPGKLVVDGGAGDDDIFARGHNPASQPLVLIGGQGRDILTGGAFAGGDVLIGGTENDVLNVQDAGSGDRVEGGDGFDEALTDTGDSFLSVEKVAQATMGRLRLAPATVHARTARPTPLKLSWTHPKRWSGLRRIVLNVHRGSSRVGRIALAPGTRRIRAKGAVKVAPGSTLTHQGKTVNARLGLMLDRSLAGGKLRVDVEATDRNGRRQLERDAAIVIVKKNR